MFLGIVERLIVHRNFDSCILLECASTQVTVTKLTANTNFSDDVNVKYTIKSGEWNISFTDITGLSCSNIIGIVAEHCFLDYAIGDCIELTYCLFIRGGGNTKNVKLSHENILNTIYFRNNSVKALPEIQLDINDLMIKIRYKIGDVIERECTRDSAYILVAMRRVGVAI